MEYDNYIEDGRQKIPKSTRYRLLNINESNSDSDDSINYDQHWQELLRNNETINSNSSNSDDNSTNESNSQSSLSSEYINQCSSDNEDNRIERLNISAESQRAINFTDNELFVTQNYLRDHFSSTSEENSLMRDVLDESDDENESDFYDEEIYFDANESIEEWNFNDRYDIFQEFIPFEKLRNEINSDEANEKIDGLVVSKIEILHVVLKFGLSYNLPHSGIADLFKMINCFLGRQLLPSTRYHVDKIFNSDFATEFHAVCPECDRYVQKFDRISDHSVTCTFCNKVILLRDPTYNKYFAIFDGTNEIKLLIRENFEHLQSVINNRLRNTENFEDFTDGVFYKNFIRSLPANKIMNSITATFNSDGSPIFESSKFSMWPIQMIINELPFKIRYNRAITCGIWFGKNKPNMNIYLKPYVENMNKLANEGIVCEINKEDKTFYVNAICCCVDSAARPAIVGFVQYNAYFGCHWCMHPGVYIRKNVRGGSIKYVLLDEPPALRNEIDTLHHMELSRRSAQPVFGVKKPSILVNLTSFNIISGFVPDSMRCICLGIAEQFASYWFDTSNMPFSLSNDNINTVDNLLLQIKSPNQICRLSRSMKERSWLKAKEFENWILFYSLPILMIFPHMTTYV